MLLLRLPHATASHACSAQRFGASLLLPFEPCRSRHRVRHQRAEPCSQLFSCFSWGGGGEQQEKHPSLLPSPRPTSTHPFASLSRFPRDNTHAKTTTNNRRVVWEQQQLSAPRWYALLVRGTRDDHERLERHRPLEKRGRVRRLDGGSGRLLDRRFCRLEVCRTRAIRATIPYHAQQASPEGERLGTCNT